MNPPEAQPAYPKYQPVSPTDPRCLKVYDTPEELASFELRAALVKLMRRAALHPMTDEQFSRLASGNELSVMVPDGVTLEDLVVCSIAASSSFFVIDDGSVELVGGIGDRGGVVEYRYFEFITTGGYSVMLDCPGSVQVERAAFG